MSTLPGVLARTQGAKKEAAPRPWDAEALADELRRRISGDVRFDKGARALYATDSSNYRQVPIGVVLPKSTDDIVETIFVCRRFGAPLTSRGAGTSLAGQCCNVAVILDMSKYLDQLIDIDPVKKLARVQPGLTLSSLEKVARHCGLTFGPDPHAACTLGGMLGNNACGAHSVISQAFGGGARTSDNVESMEVLTYDGIRMRVGPTSEADLAHILRAGGRHAEIYQKLQALRDRYADLIRSRYPKIPRRISGYNLDDLLPEKGFNVARALVGTEGTCVTILEATLRLCPAPPASALLVLGYPDIYHAGEHVPAIMLHQPVGLEGIDEALVAAMKRKHLQPQDLELLPPGQGWLLVEFGGADRREAQSVAQKLMDELRGRPDAPSMKLFDKPDEERWIWKMRESGLGASARVPNEPDHLGGWDDSAVPPEKLGSYLRDFRKLLDKYSYRSALYGHFGQGVVHSRISFDLKTHDGILDYRRFTDEAADLVIQYGGSLSGGSGDGQARGELLIKMFGGELVEAFREFKAIWDPDGRMNPGKMVETRRREDSLRYGEHYDPPELATHFHFPDDHGNFATAMERCIGVGDCRRQEIGTMCPSYRATREEMHSTRGRARLLWEMLNGLLRGKGWRDPHVHEALDLCLSCKGCKSECPTHVDMATYKAEFLSHYYARRLRPRSAYSMGLIYWWARLGAKMPNLVNFCTQTRPLAYFVKRVAGLTTRRRLPKLAQETFRDWFARRSRANIGRPRVILWPDTYHNFFQPEVAKSAVKVLESAGFEVTMPRAMLCCGRPLYDFGMLSTAKRLLRQILHSLKDDIESGTPIVGLEPACVSVFRDELVGLYPNDENARRLSCQTFLLSEFLERRAPGFKPPRLERHALVHGHCHHKSVLHFDDELAMFARMGLQCEVLDSGCCGLAGSFGYEESKFDVSVKCGEDVLLPAVREASEDELIISGGYSCREQISEFTQRRALHPAEVLQMAMRDGPLGPSSHLPERQLARQAPSKFKPVERFLIGGVVAALVLGLTAIFLRRED